MSATLLVRVRPCSSSPRLARPSTSTSCVLPTRATFLRRAMPRTTATRRSRRSPATASGTGSLRSEEHTSELQSLAYLVCRLLLEKKNQIATAALNPADVAAPIRSILAGRRNVTVLLAAADAHELGARRLRLSDSRVD